jgi:hypothetical protein
MAQLFIYYMAAERRQSEAATYVTGRMQLLFVLWAVKGAPKPKKFNHGPRQLVAALSLRHDHRPQPAP